ncbi:MAG: hypothetical protein V2I50_05175 [Desulfuromusa sp.]|jgi:hypothetical protein|nr:hypothetical protein [Desulfuromusa sp.]
MIWLSPANGTKECSIYFDIRDIDLQFSEGRSTGIVRGLVGNGSCELWGEVFLGHKEFAQILPVWTETGVMESFSDEVDETLLLHEMLSAVKNMLLRVGSIRENISYNSVQNSEVSAHPLTHHLAA